MSQRLYLADFGDSGLALNLDSGSYWRLNSQAVALTWALLQSSDSPVFPEVLGGLRDNQSDLLVLQSQFECEAKCTRIESPVSFRREETAYVMRWRGAPLLRLAADGSRVWRGESEAVPVMSALLWSLPHLLTLQRQAVLHASAVGHADGIRAFCGASGAGKTTLAECLVKQGAARISEDLLLLDLSRTEPLVILDAEPRLRAWVAETAEALARPGSERAVRDLAAHAGHCRAPLAEVIFLDRSHRCGDVLSRTSLTGAMAMENFLTNAFAELGGRDVWSQVFAMCRCLAQGVPTCTAQVPNGLEKLATAVASYNWN